MANCRGNKGRQADTCCRSFLPSLKSSRKELHQGEPPQCLLNCSLDVVESLSFHGALPAQGQVVLSESISCFFGKKNTHIVSCNQCSAVKKIATTAVLLVILYCTYEHTMMYARCTILQPFQVPVLVRDESEAPSLTSECNTTT
jgi:hypothetical protein